MSRISVLAQSSITSISEFIEFLKGQWIVGFAGIIVKVMCYLERVKKTLAKKMRCCATLDDIQGRRKLPFLISRMSF